MVSEVVASVAGMFVGMGLWFPYKFYLKRMLNKKREATAILNELAMSEQEHMKFQMPTVNIPYTHTFSGTSIGMPNYSGGTTSAVTSNPTYTNTYPTQHVNNTYRDNNMVMQSYQELQDAYAKAMSNAMQPPKKAGRRRKNPSSSGTQS